MYTSTCQDNINKATGDGEQNETCKQTAPVHLRHKKLFGATGAVDACYGFRLTGRTHLYKTFSAGWPFSGQNWLKINKFKKAYFGISDSDANYKSGFCFHRPSAQIDRRLTEKHVKIQDGLGTLQPLKNKKKKFFQALMYDRKSKFLLWQIFLLGHFFCTLCTWVKQHLKFRSIDTVQVNKM